MAWAWAWKVGAPLSISGSRGGRGPRSHAYGPVFSKHLQLYSDGSRLRSRNVSCARRKRGSQEEHKST